MSANVVDPSGGDHMLLLMNVFDEQTASYKILTASIQQLQGRFRRESRLSCDHVRQAGHEPMQHSPSPLYHLPLLLMTFSMIRKIHCYWLWSLQRRKSASILKIIWGSTFWTTSSKNAFKGILIVSLRDFNWLLCHC